MKPAAISIRNLLRRLSCLCDLRERHGADHGTTLLEFALMLPFLLLLLAGIVDIGRAIYYTIEVNNAAEAGVQYGAQTSLSAGDIAGMQNDAIADAGFPDTTATASNGCTCDPGTGVSCTYPIPGPSNCANINCPAGSQVVECFQVLTNNTWQPLIGWPGLPSSYQANGKAVMRVRK